VALEEIRHRDGFLRLIRGQGSGIVRCLTCINGFLWDEDPKFYERLKEEAADVDVTASRLPEREKENFRRDAWGCLWHYPGRYLDGQAVEHPLDDWGKLKDFRVPSPDDYTQWAEAGKGIQEAKRNGTLAGGGVEHGFLYLKMTYLRGFQNFMIDLAERRDELYQLRDMIADYWVAVVKNWVELGVDIIRFGDDLGHQNALPMSPATWREFLKPAFRRIFEVCRGNNVEVFLHTDGYIVDVIADLIEIGVTILNPQDLVNGLDNLKRLAWGKVCIDLDVDRQKITVFGRPEEIDAHIENCIRTLGSPGGGLMLRYGAYPGTPRENAAQVVRSMQKHHRLWTSTHPSEKRHL